MSNENPVKKTLKPQKPRLRGSASLGEAGWARSQPVGIGDEPGNTIICLSMNRMYSEMPIL